MDATSLALGALLVASLALVLAAHGRSLARRAGIAIRHHEASHQAEGAAPAPAPGAAADAALARLEEIADALRRRVALLEERPSAPPEPSAQAAGAAHSGAGASAQVPVPASVRVRRHLEEQGYEDIEVVPLPSGGDAFVVEARKDGATEKGRAVVDGEGGVTARVTPAFRAFP